MATTAWLRVVPLSCVRTYLLIRTRVAVFFLVATLSACSTSTNAILQTLPYVRGRGAGVDDVKLNPDYRYLRVTIGGRVALLALGYEDSDSRGTIEVWYSAEREVLRLQNGRIVGAVGLTTEWRNVLLPEFPPWSAVARSDQIFRWTRMRDLMPGYRFGVKDALSLGVAREPKLGELRGLDPQRLTWFDEWFDSGADERIRAVLGKGIASDDSLPTARYAVDIRDGRETVVYGEQCLAPDLCFTWQRWPVQTQGSVEQKR